MTGAPEDMARSWAAWRSASAAAAASCSGEPSSRISSMRLAACLTETLPVWTQAKRSSGLLSSKCSQTRSMALTVRRVEMP